MLTHFLLKQAEEEQRIKELEAYAKTLADYYEEKKKLAIEKRKNLEIYNYYNLHNGVDTI